MKDIFTIAKFTMKDMLSRKSFRYSTIFIIILIILGFNIPNIINGFTDGEGLVSKTLFVDRDHLLGSADEEDNQYTQDNDTQFWGQYNDAEIAEMILQGDIDAAWVITKSTTPDTVDIKYIVKNRATSPQPENETILLLQHAYALAQLEQRDFSDSDLQKVFPAVSVDVEQIEETEISGDITIMMLMSLVLFYAVYFCAFQVSGSITVEKTSKIIETLVTSTTPRNIVLGKTIGIGLVGLLQILVFIATAIICAGTFLEPAVLADIFDLSNITPLLGIMTIVYFLLGYFAYAMLYALTGSTVNKPEDIQSANTPVALLGAFSFYFAYFTLMDPTSSFNTFAAIFPFSSPFCMPIRMMMGLASSTEILISVAVLIVSIFIIARIAIKIYSDAILNYGTKLSLGELIRMYKQK